MFSPTHDHCGYKILGFSSLAPSRMICDVLCVYKQLQSTPACSLNAPVITHQTSGIVVFIVVEHIPEGLEQTSWSRHIGLRPSPHVVGKGRLHTHLCSKVPLQCFYDNQQDSM